jgi:hypothetical protein
MLLRATCSNIPSQRLIKYGFMKKILVLCTGNSYRSQIAEGYLRYFAGNKAQIFSAGMKMELIFLAILLII